MAQNCRRCGCYHSSSWLHCSSCGHLNPDIENKGPIVAMQSPQQPILVAHDASVPGSVLSVVPASAGSQEGRLLALLPPSHDGLGWSFVLRRNGEHVLEDLRAKITVLEGTLAATEKELEAHRFDLNRAMGDAEQKHLNIQDLEKRRKEEREIHSDVRDAKNRLEADMGKVRSALGSKGLAEILNKAET